MTNPVIPANLPFVNSKSLLPVQEPKEGVSLWKSIKPDAQELPARYKGHIDLSTYQNNNVSLEKTLNWGESNIPSNRKLKVSVPTNQTGLELTVADDDGEEQTFFLPCFSDDPDIPNIIDLEFFKREGDSEWRVKLATKNKDNTQQKRESNPLKDKNHGAAVHYERYMEKFKELNSLAKDGARELNESADPKQASNDQEDKNLSDEKQKIEIKPDSLSSKALGAAAAVAGAGAIGFGLRHYGKFPDLNAVKNKVVAAGNWAMNAGAQAIKAAKNLSWPTTDSAEQDKQVAIYNPQQHSSSSPQVDDLSDQDKQLAIRNQNNALAINRQGTDAPAQSSDALNDRSKTADQNNAVALYEQPTPDPQITDQQVDGLDDQNKQLEIRNQNNALAIDHRQGTDAQAQDIDALTEEAMTPSQSNAVALYEQHISDPQITDQQVDGLGDQNKQLEIRNQNNALAINHRQGTDAPAQSSDALNDRSKTADQNNAVALYEQPTPNPQITDQQVDGLDDQNKQLEIRNQNNALAIDHRQDTDAQAQDIDALTEEAMTPSQSNAVALYEQHISDPQISDQQIDGLGDQNKQLEIRNQNNALAINHRQGTDAPAQSSDVLNDRSKTADQNNAVALYEQSTPNPQITDQQVDGLNDQNKQLEIRNQNNALEINHRQGTDAQAQDIDALTEEAMTPSQSNAVALYEQHISNPEITDAQAQSFDELIGQTTPYYPDTPFNATNTTGWNDTSWDGLSLLPNQTLPTITNATQVESMLNNSLTQPSALANVNRLPTSTHRTGMGLAHASTGAAAAAAIIWVLRRLTRGSRKPQSSTPSHTPSQNKREQSKQFSTKISITQKAPSQKPAQEGSSKFESPSVDNKKSNATTTINWNSYLENLKESERHLMRLAISWANTSWEAPTSLDVHGSVYTNEILRPALDTFKAELITPTDARTNFINDKQWIENYFDGLLHANYRNWRQENPSN